MGVGGGGVVARVRVCACAHVCMHVRVYALKHLLILPQIFH